MAASKTKTHAKQDGFTHYARGSMGFLVELTENNDRQWFKDNQPRYESLVREPTRAFVRAMAPRIEKLSPHLVASDSKVGGSMMRPQRDTRFARDKTPYKTNVGVQFRHIAGKDVHAPGLYVHMDPAEVFVGVGMWHPDGPSLQAIRKAIDEDPKGWKRARDQAAFTSLFELSGDSLKRPPKGYDADHPLLEDLKRKDFIGISHMKVGDLFKPGFVGEVERRFKAGKGLMRFLCKAIDQPF